MTTGPLPQASRATDTPHRDEGTPIGLFSKSDESVRPTTKEWEHMLRKQGSDTGQRAQRDSTRTADAARAAGRSIAEQRAHEKGR